MDTHGLFLLHEKVNYIIPIIPCIYNNNIYINLEGRPQKSFAISFSSKVFKSFIHIKNFFKLFLNLTSCYKFLKAYNWLSINSFIFNNFTTKFKKIILNKDNFLISTYPLKNYLESSFNLSKLKHFYKTLYIKETVIKKYFTNFLK
jgi:hypothetical protein